MNTEPFVKTLQIMRLAEMAAARPEGICLTQIAEAFNVNARTSQRMIRALEMIFPTVRTYTDPHRRKWWQLGDSRILHMQGIRDSELVALEMGIRRAEREGAMTDASALNSLRDRLLAIMPTPFARRAEVDAEAVLEALGHACRPVPRVQYSRRLLMTINVALKGPHELQMTYAGAQDTEPRQRVVEPYGVLFGMRSFTNSCRGSIISVRHGRSRSSCCSGRGRCFMTRTEIAGFQPKSYKTLHLNTRKNATSYSKINAMNINQGELLSRFSVKVGWDDRATLANRAILYENARAQKTGTLCQRQSKSEPKGSAKCCHFGVSEIAA